VLALLPIQLLKRNERERDKREKETSKRKLENELGYYNHSGKGK
jgi:hypothetical protein